MESRYQLVNTLYGPGTVSAWLLTFAAVLISWTLNIQTRREDTFTLDFVAVLLLPCVAAGHIIFQIIRLPVPVQEILTSKDPDIQQYAAALEAPINICESFSVASLILAICCGPWFGIYSKTRRLALVILAGLFCWSTENILFVLATLRGVDAADIQLSRPYLFLLTPLIGCIWAFLFCLLVVMFIRWMMGTHLTHNNHRWPLESHSPKSEQMDRIIELTSTGMSPAEAVEKSTSELQTTRFVLPLTMLSILFLPISFVISLVSILKAEETTTTIAENPSTFFLIPPSNSSLQDLDQILTLVSGVLILLTSATKAYRSRHQPVTRNALQRRQSI